MTAPIDTCDAHSYNLGDSHERHEDPDHRRAFGVNAMSSRSANLSTRGLSPLAAAIPVLAAALFAGAPAAAGQDAASAPAVDFQRQVRPILADNCFQCHGPDESTRQVRLRLDTEEGAFAERPNGHPIVRGDAESSLIFQRIAHANARLRMPPTHTNKTLNDEQIDVLRRWIDGGASWDQHWAFEPIVRPETPAVADSDWARNPLDRFVLARLEAQGLAPAPTADRPTLARRAALDLTGLPPDPALLHAFLNDPSEDAYERYVDRLLATEQWGEHRARYWLDAARYGDTHGIHIDNYREMWAVPRLGDSTRSTANQPFDEFTTLEQIAGDLLPEPSARAAHRHRLPAQQHHHQRRRRRAGRVRGDLRQRPSGDGRRRVPRPHRRLRHLPRPQVRPHPRSASSTRLTAFFRNTTQYVMDGNVSDPPPILVVPQETDRELWYDLREEAADVEALMAHRAAAVDTAFTEWLATGDYRNLQSPLEDDAQWMRLDLGEPADPAFEMEGQRHPVTLEGGAKIEAGPHGQAALRFDDASWAGLPSLPLDTDTPFSIALWIYQPELEGNYVVAGQYDPDDGNRGWSMDIGSRQLSFRMTGEPDPDGEGRPAPRVAPSNLRRLAPGEWTHIVITHDGTGERAGMNVFRDGDVVEASGSEYFTRAIGSIRTGLRLELGRGRTTGRGGRDELEMRYFTGGGIADQCASSIARSRCRRPGSSHSGRLWSRRGTSTPRRSTRPSGRPCGSTISASKDERYRGLVARSQQIEREWREMRRRGGVTHVMNERTDSDAAAHVLNRGMYDQPLERVLAGTPAALPPMEESWPRNRLGLARWLVDEDNPLTSRVTANRFWQQVFGTGLVTTSEDFGAQGDPPTHPALLDWLAVEFRASGWDVKQFFPDAGDVVHLPAVRPDDAGEAGGGPGEPTVLARAALPDGRRDGARLRPGRQRAAHADDRRPQRAAVSAGRCLVDGGDAAEQYPGLPAGRRREPVPQELLYVLEAVGAAAVHGDLQRPDPRALRRAAGADEHPAAGAGDDERSAIRRGVAAPGPARDAAGGRRVRAAARLRDPAVLLARRFSDGEREIARRSYDRLVEAYRADAG